MTWSYSPKHLGAGSIGGNGLWLIKQCSFGNYDGLDGAAARFTIAYNTNLVTQRALADASVFNEQLPYIGGFAPLDFIHGYSAGSTVWNGIKVGTGPFLTEYPWINHATFDGYNLYVRNYESNPEAQRHAHRVLLNNVRGSFIASATRVQLGSSGYFDPLPGLFVIEPVPGTIIANTSAYVTISFYPNLRTYWLSGSQSVLINKDMAYGSVGHPYLRDSANAVLVSLAPGNANKHVIPGVSITFNNGINGDKAIISIGYEYVNRRSELGDFGSISGIEEFYLPQTDFCLQPYDRALSKKRDFNHIGAPYSLRGDFPIYKIYNITGDVLEGCKFSIRPFPRLDQGNALYPFDSWYLGYDATTGLPVSSIPYTLTFSGYVAGSPARINLSCSYGGVSMLIREINSTTYQPTGTVHSDGTGLKCDGTTLYRWDAVGVYFILSTQARSGHTALVHVRKGQHTEKYVQMTGSNYDAWTEYYTPWSLVNAPTSQVIGGWDGITNSGTGDKYPISHGAPEARRTSIIQHQGHEFDFFNAGIDPTNEHWYNHHTQVGTIGLWTDQEVADNPYEWCVMATCSDPRYFSVAPRMMRYTYSRHSGGTVDDMMPKLTANIGVPDADSEYKLTGNIQERDGSLVLRINQISSDLMAVLEEAGITVE